MAKNRSKMGQKFQKIGQNKVLIPREYLKKSKKGEKWTKLCPKWAKHWPKMKIALNRR